MVCSMPTTHESYRDLYCIVDAPYDRYRTIGFRINVFKTKYNVAFKYQCNAM